MDILQIMRNSTPEECEEIGRLILEMGTKPRTVAWYADIDTAIALQPKPSESTIVEAIENGAKRVMALNEGLVADGMNHERLITEELKRRGDKRTLVEYVADVGGDAVGDVIHSR